MLAFETTLEELFKHNPDFLKACQQFGWARLNRREGRQTGNGYSNWAIN